MKVDVSYVCGICGTRYGTEELCMECENSHLTAVKIKKGKYNPFLIDSMGYPKEIVVEMSNGDLVTYKKA